MAERDICGRLAVDDETLIVNARGIALALALRIETLMAILNCDQREAEHFRESAWADWSRLVMAARR